MALKGWFGGKGRGSQQEYTVDDLIVLERYEEAAGRLREKLKVNPQDLHSHLKLAEVYTELRQLDLAVDEYAFVADEYAQDGFYDKGIALLSRASKLSPNDVSLRERIEAQQREKSMDHVRVLAIEGLRQAGGQVDGTSALELQRLWHNLASSLLVQTMPGEQLKRLFAAMRLHHLETGAMVAQEGGQEPFLLLVARGSVEATVQLASGAAPTLVRELGPGDVMGEAALLERGSWPADYRVGEALTALQLTRAGLEKCLVGQADPRGFLEMLRGQHLDREVAAAVRTLRDVR
ncbi:MAG TPA: cyclic nucleotide-binding domain-containing protein [Thermoanaerobaculia bacterium]|nr:cyclic nucleotide-binding domain-containing protein [Thermoanaerobaculia bacterium]